MSLKTINYREYLENIPAAGQHILAQQTDENIVVYQAYSNPIADFAIKNQYFGGSSFSMNRMTWIKPNFLWMMYRCGWASKENQERVLAITIKKSFFNEILAAAAYSSFNSDVYSTREEWQHDINNSEVRLQWDPDHDLYGNKQERRAIQLGMKGKIMERYAKDEIVKIADITCFVKEQRSAMEFKKLELLSVPFEQLYYPADERLAEKLKLS